MAIENTNATDAKFAPKKKIFKNTSIQPTKTKMVTCAARPATLTSIAAIVARLSISTVKKSVKNAKSYGAATGTPSRENARVVGSMGIN